MAIDRMSTIIVVLGDKGGIGKTTVAGLIYDWLRAKNLKVEAWDYDGGRANTLRSVLPEAKPGDIDKRDSLFWSLGNLESAKPPDVLLVDLGARNEQRSAPWFEAAHGAVAANWVVLLPVIQDPASWPSAVNWCKIVRDRATKVFVRNAQADEAPNWEPWTAFEPANDLRQLGVLEVDLAAANPELMRVLQQEHKRLGQVLSGEGLPEESWLRTLPARLLARQVVLPFFEALDNAKILQI